MDTNAADADTFSPPTPFSVLAPTGHGTDCVCCQLADELTWIGHEALPLYATAPSLDSSCMSFVAEAEHVLLLDSIQCEQNVSRADVALPIMVWPIMHDMPDDFAARILRHRTRTQRNELIRFSAHERTLPRATTAQTQTLPSWTRLCMATAREILPIRKQTRRLRLLRPQQSARPVCRSLTLLT
jgi:hypothetical protein